MLGSSVRGSIIGRRFTSSPPVLRQLIVLKEDCPYQTAYRIILFSSRQGTDLTQRTPRHDYNKTRVLKWIVTATSNQKKYTAVHVFSVGEDNRS